MERNEKELVVANVQYDKKKLSDGYFELHINGHVANEYFETTAIIHPDEMKNTLNLERFLKKCLLNARDKTQKLREKKEE